MKRNAIMPYVLIATLGLVAMIVMSGVGLAQMNFAEGESSEADVEMDPEAIYNNNCMSCHGGDLGGSGMAPGLTDVGDKYTMEELVDIIANGVEGSAVMTGNYATDAQAEVVAEWLMEGQ